MSNINKWANFLKNEKLDPAVLSEKDTLKLMMLAAKLAESGPPKIGSHADKQESRRKVCNTAFDMAIDLMGMKKQKYHGGSKPAIGRGLLDVWNEQYKIRFGSTVGTLGASEVTRRTVVTRLSEQREREQRTELRALIVEGKHTAEQLAERFGLPLAFVRNQIENNVQACIVASVPNVPTPPETYAKAIRALMRNGTTLEYISGRTGRSVEELKKILEENPCSTPTTPSSPLGQSAPTS
jgi:hypothetical protein